MDLFVLQLAIIFLPGLLWARLDAQFVAKSKPSETEQLIRAFLFGLSSYIVTFLIFWTLGRRFVFGDLASSSARVIFGPDLLWEIFWATVVSLVLAIIWIYAETYKVFVRFLQFLRATKRYGDEDVWDFIFNSRDATVEYVHLRDFEKQIVYAGWVRVFSETGRLRELVLRDVEVYDFGSKKLFDVPLLYLSRLPENLHVEFPYKG